DVQCSGCGAEHPADARYCMRCGQHVGASPEEDPRNIVPDRRRHAPAEAAYFRKLLEQLPLGAYVATLRPEGRLLYITPYVARTLGISADALLSDPDYWTTLLHPDDRARVLDAVGRLIGAGEPLQVECYVVRPDGQERWWQ